MNRRPVPTHVRGFRALAAASAAVVVTGATSPAGAAVDTRTYLGLSGSSFSLPLNWSPSKPDADDVALFDRNLSYLVNVDADASVGQLRVTAGELTLNLATGTSSSATPKTLTLTATSGPGVIVGDATGQTAALVLSAPGGTLQMSGAHQNYIGNAAGSTGTVTVAGPGTGAATKWTGIHDLIVGNAGTGTLALVGNARVSNNWAYVGHAAGGAGTVNVTGPQAKWQNQYNVFLGYSGKGTLNVSGGGQVTSDDGYVGITAAAEGTATVTGSGSKWALGGDLLVGYEGKGTLDVRSGGTVTADVAVVGTMKDSRGILDLSGAGSALTLASHFMVGAAGAGTLWATDGAAVNVGGDFTMTDSAGGYSLVTFESGAQLNVAGTITVGKGLGYAQLQLLRGGSAVTGSALLGNLKGDEFTNGIAIVDGGSHWEINGTLVAAHRGNGVLSVSDGSTVRTTLFARVGQEAGASGRITLAKQAEFSTGSSLIVGDRGTGTLHVGSGSTVSAAEYTGIGFDTGGVGTATVTGEGSRLTQAGELLVGYRGTGTLTVSAGATVTSGGDARLGHEAGARGTLTVTGAGSRWTTRDAFLGIGGAATLAVQDGGAVAGRHMRVSTGFGTGTGSAAVSVTGAGSLLELSGDLLVGTTGTTTTGTVLVGDGATLRTTAWITAFQAGRVTLDGGTIAARGVAVQTGGTLDWRRGTLRLTGPEGGYLLDPGSVLGSALTLSADRTLDLAGLLEIRSGGSLTVGGGAQEIATLNNQGTVNHAAGTFIVANTLSNYGTMNVTAPAFAAGRLTNMGQFTAVGSTLTLSGHPQDPSATGLVNHGAAEFVRSTINGHVVAAPGSRIEYLGGLTINGAVNGTGTFAGSGTLTFNGSLAPGFSPGTIRITGDAAFGDDHTLLMEIAGPSDFDRLVVSGNLALDGDLSVAFLNGYLPSDGDTFELLDAGSMSGQFDSIFLPALAGGLMWDTTSLIATGTVAVTAVPEPTSAAVVGVAGAVAALGRRGRRQRRRGA